MRSNARDRVVAGAAMTVLLALPAAAQSSVPAPYRPPTIALVQPSGADPVPRDKPIVVFRFAPGESDDPIDARSFTIRVDGVDRSAGFRVAADEAWGSLGGEGRDDPPVTPGPHAVTARICSIRGACAQASVSVSVEGDPGSKATPSTPAAAGEKPPSSRTRLIARVLDAVRRILVP